VPDPNAIVDAVVAVLRAEASTLGLARVENYRPFTVDAQDTPFAYVWISSKHEQRMGLGGPAGGTKRGTSQVVVEIEWSSSDPATAEPQFRTLVENVARCVGTHQTLGGVVQRYGEDLDIRHNPPQGDSQATRAHYFASITSPAMQEYAP